MQVIPLIGIKGSDAPNVPIRRPCTLGCIVIRLLSKLYCDKGPLYSVAFTKSQGEIDKVLCFNEKAK